MILIIGAGLAGLSTAYHLGKGQDYQICEKEKQSGGLCRSYTMNGFTFDYTGHLLHTRQDYIRSLLEMLLPGKLSVHRRQASIYSQKITRLSGRIANLLTMEEIWQKLTCVLITRKLKNSIQALRVVTDDQGIHCVINELPMPEAGPGEVLIRVRASAICGTDVRIFTGRKTREIRHGHPIGHALQVAGLLAEGDMIDLADLERAMSGEVAALMVTNPNTLGVFEADICRIGEIVHAKGGFLYMDGANMNALAGVARPGDMNVDVLHVNLHKTFSTPHGGGGPGSGPVGVKKELVPFLPVPVVTRTKDGLVLDYDRPAAIGRVRSFCGNFGVVLRALAYILTLGPEGLREMAQIAVLNANYIRKSLEGLFHLKYGTPTLHECVFSDKLQLENGIKNVDIAKRLIDYGLHPPTMSFPLIVHGALMIEPTETESRRDLDAFIEAMTAIAREARETPDILRAAPHQSFVRRLDETAAAKKQILRWKPSA